MKLKTVILRDLRFLQREMLGRVMQVQRVEYRYVETEMDYVRNSLMLIFLRNIVFSVNFAPIFLPAPLASIDFFFFQILFDALSREPLARMACLKDTILFTELSRYTIVRLSNIFSALFLELARPTNIYGSVHFVWPKHYHEIRSS